MGLWLVQECRRAWAAQGQSYSYDELTQMATHSSPLQAIIDPDCHEFLKPGDMPARIRAYCQQTGQTAPENEGAVVRYVLESLAVKYRWVLEQLEALLERRLDPIHSVGGGTQNKLLNQFTADATNRQVIAGPVEATATGNIMMQAISLGHIGSVKQGREIVQRSFEVMTYQPSDGAAWDEAYSRLLTLIFPRKNRGFVKRKIQNWAGR